MVTTVTIALETMVPITKRSDINGIECKGFGSDIIVVSGMERERYQRADRHQKLQSRRQQRKRL